MNVHLIAELDPTSTMSADPPRPAPTVGSRQILLSTRPPWFWRSIFCQARDLCLSLTQLSATSNEVSRAIGSRCSWSSGRSSCQLYIDTTYIAASMWATDQAIASIDRSTMWIGHIYVCIYANRCAHLYMSQLLFEGLEPSVERGHVYSS